MYNSIEQYNLLQCDLKTAEETNTKLESEKSQKSKEQPGSNPLKSQRFKIIVLAISFVPEIKCLAYCII